MRVEHSQAEGSPIVPIFSCLVTDGGAFYSVGASITMAGRVILRNNRAETRGGEHTYSRDKIYRSDG